MPGPGLLGERGPALATLVEAMEALGRGRLVLAAADFSFSASTAEGGKKFRGNNLLFEAGLTLGEEQGFENRVLRAGFGYHRTFTRFGADLGNTYELNLTYAWQ